MVQYKAALIAFAMTGLAGAALAAPPTPVYLMKAGASDLYEKTSSKVVLETTHNPAIRSFANMMVMDHSKSTAKVKAAALRSGAHPKPPALDPMQQKMVAELRHARGSDRDRLYVEQQKKAHGMALSLHQDYAASGSDPALRHAASEIVPVVQEHIAKLAAMPM